MNWIEFWRSKKPTWRRRPVAPAYVVLHHTAGPVNQAPQVIWDYHVKVRGWPHVGYHYLVYHDGTVVKMLPLSAQPICVGEYNHLAICIALVGNFVGGYPPEWNERAPGWQSLVRLVRELRKHDSGLRLRLARHKDLRPTQCPGVVTWEEALVRGGVPQEQVEMLKAAGVIV